MKKILFIILLFPIISNAQWSVQNYQFNVTNSGNVGIGTETPLSTYNGLDISSSGMSLVLGADYINKNTRTNNNNKVFRIASPKYDKSDSLFCVMYGGSNSVENTISIGGGTSSLYSTNHINFYTSNLQTHTGTLRMQVDTIGRLILDTSIAIQKAFLTVYKRLSQEAGDAGAYLYSKNTNTSCTNDWYGVWAQADGVGMGIGLYATGTKFGAYINNGCKIHGSLIQTQGNDVSPNISHTLKLSGANTFVVNNSIEDTIVSIQMVDGAGTNIYGTQVILDVPAGITFVKGTYLMLKDDTNLTTTAETMISFVIIHEGSAIKWKELYRTVIGGEL